MKKLFLLVIPFLCYMFSALTPLSANADTKYLRIIDKSTPLYLNEDLSTIICNLPYTYYLIMLEELENSYHVEVTSLNAPSIDGYVEKDKLFYDGLSVVTPYPDISLSTTNHTPLYSDNSLQTSECFIFSNRNLSYYGYLQTGSGSYLYFVSYGDKLGYVKEEDISPFTIENHKNPLTFIEDKPSGVIKTETNPNPENNDNFTFKILVIVCLILAGIIALFVVLRPKKRQDKNSYYSENEYE